ncbi:MAG: hypothetical protein ACD_40C00108G0006 [uncultured bacterium]|nr:MAG: hypothetical protein ACD_40C00108G0006 [uncultured bacterium]
MTSNYLHVFTDGLDKLLPASIYLPHWGDDQAFIYYTQGKLKGYVSVLGMKKLSSQGIKLLTNTAFVESLLSKSDLITTKANCLHDQIQPTQINIGDSSKLFIQATSLLSKGYRLYFYTEEYMTDNLEQAKYPTLISKIGKYRLNFNQINIQLTEDVYNLAGLIGTKHGFSKKEVQFLSYEEIVNLTPKFDHSIIKNRQSAFFLSKTTANRIVISDSLSAKIEFKKRTNSIIKKINQFSGRGACQGLVTGKVYLISVSDKNLNKRLSSIPQGAILVTEITQPNFTVACKKAGAIITDEGGVLSHAAIISREFNIPCVVGTRIATQVLKNGQTVKVNGTKGVVEIIS